MSQRFHIIGRARNRVGLFLQLYLTDTFRHSEGPRFYVSSCNHVRTFDLYGAFVTPQQMQNLYLSHPLSSMGNQPQHYHREGHQGLEVRKLNNNDMLFAITNPLHNGGPLGAKHEFVVEYAKLVTAASAAMARYLTKRYSISPPANAPYEDLLEAYQTLIAPVPLLAEQQAARL